MNWLRDSSRFTEQDDTSHVSPVKRKLFIRGGTRWRPPGVIFYLLIALTTIAPVLHDASTRYIGGPGDPEQFMWYLHWFWYAILHHKNPFFTSLLNYPNGQNLMWNTSILSVSAVFGWLTWLLPSALVYNLLWVFNQCLASVFGEKILRLLGVRRRLAIFGGVLTGILPYSTAQTLFHLHLWWTSTILFMLWWVIRAYVRDSQHRGEIRDVQRLEETRDVRGPVITWVWFGFVLGAAAVFQFYTSIEVFATLALITFVFVVVHLVVGGRQRLHIFRLFRLSSLIPTVLTLFLGIAPGLYALFKGAARPAGGLLPGDVYVNDLFNIVLPTPVYLVHNSFSDVISMLYTGNFWENNGYLGVPCIISLVLAAFFLKSKPYVRTGVTTVLITTVLSLGPRVHSAGHRTDIYMPWSWLQHLPLIESAIPSRIMLYADIIVVLVLVYGAEQWIKRHYSRRATTYSLICLLVLFISWLPRFPFFITETPPASNALAEGTPVYAAVEGQPTYVLAKDPSVFMQALGDAQFLFPMVNPYGYTNNDWPRHLALYQLHQLALSKLTPADTRHALTQLPLLHARRVLYYPQTPDDRLPVYIYQAVVSVLGNPIAESDGAIVWAVQP